MSAPRKLKPVRYEVQMRREIVQLAVVEVEAKDEYEAAQKAQAQRESLDWSTTDSNYEAVYAEKI